MRQGRWTIKHQALLLGMLPCVVMFILLTSYTIISNQQLLDISISHRLQSHALHIAQALDHSPWPEVQEKLKSLIDNEMLCYIRIEYPDGSPLISLVESDYEEYDERTEYQLALNYSPASPLYQGQIIVGLSRDYEHTGQLPYLVSVIVAGSITLLIAFLMANYLAKSITLPIQHITQTLQHFEAHQFTPVQLTSQKAGVLQPLVAAVNHLGTALTQAEQQRQHFTNELIETSHQAKMASQAKSDFLAMMSHELRTPMNGVLGMLQLLDCTELNHEQREYIKIASNSTEHLLKVINDILDFSRIERGQLTLEQDIFNLHEALKSCARIFQHHAAAKGLQLITQFSNISPGLQVFADATRLKQVIINLISNAIKFTHQGSITLEAHLKEQTKQPTVFTCRIVDTGIGIAKDRLEHIFNPFQQADTFSVRKYSGSGLGLSIAKTLVNIMGGSLSVDSIEEQGSTFSFSIPIQLNNTQNHSSLPLIQPLPSSQETTILLVEDNPINQTVITGMLGVMGFQVESAESGVKAVNIATTHHYALILMDLHLPDIDGFQCCRQIKQLLASRQQQTPIIALITEFSPEIKKQCIACGMDDFLSKPFTRNQLRDKLAQHLKDFYGHQQNKRSHYVKPSNV
ncbi:response regulator [Zooshikella marina]|uniref:ATP-binding protein n=1 Tax=Zooshikella ganghwensis TaxID=202772 RepID=UPI001BAF3DE7|nr:ATP-binding protein [Zooshikella ganghwensis]MBU2705325.1 response regulator [Zooshikella ganghwensis]